LVGILVSIIAFIGSIVADYAIVQGIGQLGRQRLVNRSKQLDYKEETGASAGFFIASQ
jgi:hypothetical protein